MASGQEASVQCSVGGYPPKSKAANAENPGLGGRIQGLTRLGVSFSSLSMLVNPWITNSPLSTVLEELCLLGLLFFLLFQYEQESSKAFIKGEILIISTESTHFFPPPLRPHCGLKAVGSQVLEVLCCDRAQGWCQCAGQRGASDTKKDLPKPIGRPIQRFLLP